MKFYLDLILRSKSLIRALGERRLRQIIPNCGLQDGLKVLIAGGGHRSSEQRLFSGLKINKMVSVNISPSLSPDIIADLEKPWPICNETFHLLLSIWVLEHVRESRVFLAEARRCLVSGGKLILAVPFIHPKHGSPDDFMRYSDSYLSWICRTCGFGSVTPYALGSGPFLACTSLLWPIMRLPAIGFLVACVAFLCDHLLKLVTLVSGKGEALVQSYKIGYIVVAKK